MAWTILPSENGFSNFSESLIIPDSAGANETTINSTVIGSGFGGPINISNTAFGISVEVTEICAGDGAIDARLQGSIDGTTFVNVDTSASMNVDPTGLNTGGGICTGTSNYFPQWRIQLFTDGTDILDACTVTLKISVIELTTVRSVV